MRLTSIDIRPSNSGNAINLSFKDPRNLNPYNVKGILGLDADEITTRFYGVSPVSNDKFYDLSLSNRNIVVYIGLNPNVKLGKSYSDLRDDLYRLISSSRTGAVQLRFNNGAKTLAAISGFITKLESSQFSKTPDVQLTIRCSDPMLKALDLVNVNVAGLDPALTTITDDKSTAPHGFQFSVLFSASNYGFGFRDVDGVTWLFQINVAGSPLVEFVAGDRLHISSEHNNRHAYLVRGTDTIQLVDRIQPGSLWPIIFPGANDFRLSKFVTWEYIRYYPTYWGV